MKELLAPLSREEVRTVRCLGLNYERHAKEVCHPFLLCTLCSVDYTTISSCCFKLKAPTKQTNMPIPTNPILFYKPLTALTGPFSSIPVPQLAQASPGLDYECELIVIIGRAAKNIPTSDASDYILGYSVGNDVSHREWQLLRGGGQWSLGKGFDGWAPFGPGIVSPTTLLKPPQDLRIFTKLNGHVVQDSSTKDMVFSVAQTVSFLSQGTTLLPGDVIFTGT